MHMQSITRAKARPVRLPTIDAAIGILVLSASALMLLPSLALYAVYVAAALVARAFWKNPRAGR
ncbi:MULTISPECIES: hypothetical protein [unclassified Sphingomonas]|uniref:hypothetical protein n=1 Tax=unclassified Sphingomonas TaxID=196159 RepID=UPI000BCF4A75|nr:MAG: hypothetical protein B7Z43_09105 [Sphingomonas sp. 12-62-6]OYX38353.1 MAG: hypothetical protein B7Y98_09025 [Sphingomonas sp. 32-62-10]OYY64054.1 MAG: hypothetical protein B7Y49_11055 [Sphingomonas sp. 28-62-11]